MSTEAVDAKDKERAKRIHYRVMVVLGFLILGSGLWAGYLAFTTGSIPGFLVRRWTTAAPEPSTRLGASGRVHWLSYSPATLAQARKEHRLILLDLTVSWCRACHVMDETTYADAGIAAWVESRTLPVRVDGDDRPDLALRYLAGGWPTTALLLPTGETLSSGTLMPPERFLAWAQAVVRSYEARGDEFEASAAHAAATEPLPDTAVAAPELQRALLDSHLKLEKDWDGESSGFGSGPRFPSFGRIGALSALQGVAGAQWAPTLARAASAGTLKLEDPVWGGFFRYAAGPGWDNPEHEKLLNDQAEAVLALGGLQDPAVGRALAYVREFLSAPGGGWAASQSAEVTRPDGQIVEGRYYYSLSDDKRRALGIPAVDSRLFAAPNARMARAILRSRVADDADRRQALSTLNRFWSQAMEKDGGVRHRLASGPKELRGYLEDQTSLTRAFLAAYRNTGDDEWLARARTTERYMEESLKDPESPAFLDRPAAGELAPRLDRAALPALNVEAALTLQETAEALPSSSPERARLTARAGALLRWLASRSASLDPASWALLVAQQPKAHP